LSEVSEWPSAHRKLAKKAQPNSLIAILTTFARIDERDLQKCATMPLTLLACSVLGHHSDKSSRANSSLTTGKPIGLLTAFEVLSNLLIGQLFRTEYVKPAVLVSAWGWSIFFNSLDALDPEDVATSSMRVVCGVPARRGLRRSRVIDGPTDTEISETKILTSPRVGICPGIGAAIRGTTLVEVHADAFQVTQIFSWVSCKSFVKAEKNFKTGLRKMQEICLPLDKLSPCQCDANRSNPFPWCIEYEGPGDLMFAVKPSQSGSSMLYWKNMRQAWPTSQLLERVGEVVCRSSNMPEPSSYTSVFHAFDVSANPAARWLQLSSLRTIWSEEMHISIRCRGTCPKCATLMSIQDTSQRTMLLS